MEKYQGWIIAGVCLLIISYIVGMYNKLVIARQRVKEGFADIETQLKRRHDLIPNLVEIVKGYASHEKKTLEDVTKARANTLNNQGIKETEVAENLLSSALKSLFAITENYPELKANQNFLELQTELSDTENKIQASRRFYNTTVLDYNTKTEVFPSNVIAKLFEFVPEQFFEVDTAEKQKIKEAPKVGF